jgi:glycine reductase
VISKEIERAGIPVALITAMVMVGKQTKSGRVIAGVKIAYPCGNPSLNPESDFALRKEIVKCALGALQTDVSSPTEFAPSIEYVRG